MPWTTLADAVLLTHAAFVGFVVVGFVLTLAGLWRGWAWVRNARFRGLHLAAILYVVVQSWLGVECPLTTLESSLRIRGGEAAYRESFIQDWVYRLLYYEAGAWVFVAVYTLFGAAVLITWWLAGPRRRDHRRAAGSSR